jgi:hypothetical protein
LLIPIDLLLFRVRTGVRTTGGAEPRYVLADRVDVEDTADPQRAPEGTAPFREREAGRVGVK